MLDLGTALELVQRHVRHNYADCAREYGDPREDASQAGILFADWNDCPKWLSAGLERRGFNLEWSDEWITAGETGKAYRTSPTHYGWLPYYVIDGARGDVIGGDEIENGGSESEWYVNEYLVNNATRCNIFRGVNLESFGFEVWNGEFETGFHLGQNDDPRKVLARLNREKPGYDVVFDMIDVGQFDQRWRALIRAPRQDD